MKTMNKQELLDFSLSFTAGLDQIAKHEFDTTTIAAVITTLMVEMGYDKRDAYAAPLWLDQELMLLGGLQGSITKIDAPLAVVLAGHIKGATEAAEQNRIPDFVYEQVDKIA